MNQFKKLLQIIDMWQRRHRAVAFPYAVIKKYGEDEAGYQSALLTYYGFLSLFPLLLVLTTVTAMLAGRNEALRHTIIGGLTTYFPMFANQLSSHVQTIHKSGLPLLIGIVFTLYGTRGVADAFRNGVNHIWQIPRTKRTSFPLSIVKSLGLIIVGGSGFLLASISSTLAATSGHGWLFKLLSIVINLFILFWLFTFLLNISLPRHVPLRQTRSGAITAAIGLVILQSVGGILLTRELKSLDALYSYFALALGLLFWIYLQAQVVYYSVEVASVKAQKLWPRGLDNSNLTEADKRAYDRQAAKEQVVPSQDIKTKFQN